MAVGLIIFVSIHVVCHGQTVLKSAPVDLDRLCSGNKMVTFTCTAENINSSLSWYLNGVEHALYSTDAVPYLSPIVMHMDPQILEIRPIQGIPNAFDVTAELTTNTSVLDVFNISTVQCTTDGRSSSSTIELRILGLAPLSSQYSCLLTPYPSTVGDLELLFNWSPSFNFEYTVERYNVSITPDPSACSSDQVMPTEGYRCSGLDPDVDYVIRISAINCGDQEGVADIIPLQFELPQDASSITTILDYTDRGQLTNVSVKWSDNQTSTLRLISGKCFYNGTLIYTVLPEDSLMANQIVVRSEDCSKNICLISFMMPTFTRVMNIEFGFFATDGMKLRTMEAVNVTIAASIETTVRQLLNSSIRFEECIAYVFCDAPGYRGYCDLSYGQDSSYNDLGIPNRVPVNILSSLLLSFSSTVYFYELSHTINTTVVIRFRDYFRTVKFADSLSFFNQNFMIGGIATWGVGISAYIILIVLRPKREKGSRLILSVALLIVGSIVIIASAVLWFAVALHIGLQSGSERIESHTDCALCQSN